MRSHRAKRAPGCRAMVVALVTASVAGLSTFGAAPRADKATKPSRTDKDERAEVRALQETFQGLADAVREDGGSTPEEDRAAAALRAMNRPPKVITPPTLDAAAIDALIAQSLAEAGAPTAVRTTDEEFVRRVSLDVAGKLPTPAQVRAFVLSRDRDKRAKLIDSLLASPDSARNWARYWRDVVAYRATNPVVRLLDFPALEEWLVEQLEQNRPWDEIAAALITANGFSADNGAVAFQLAHADQGRISPVELAGEVSRIFLGVQIQCAECHDHPNDPWKRQQFHEFAAFFAGTRARRSAGAQSPPEVIATARASYTMPDLKDPQKPIPVRPRFFLAASSEPVPARLSVQQRRELAASYVTGQDNPWFAKAFVNRVWYALMGESFYTPVDDLGPTREPNAPEVLEALAAQWQQGGYDIQWLFRTILNTRAYQRATRSTNTVVGRTPFASNCPSRLRADQIFDALAQALDLKVAAAGGGRRSGQGQAGAAVPKGAARNPRSLFNFLFGVDPSTPHEEVLGTIPQALFLMNSPQVNRAITAGRGTVLGEILATAPDDRTALEALYLRVLSRRPSSREVALCGKYLMSVRNRREAFEDILWSLINSTEFVSRR